jgi:heat shock protein HtpX
MILAQWYFSDKIVLWSSGAKLVTRDQFPELHDLVERIVARNNLPKPKIAVIRVCQMHLQLAKDPSHL